MQVYEVIGQVTLSRVHPTLRGSRLLAAKAVGHELLGQAAPADEELVVVWDNLGAGIGSRIALSDGGEAAQPFRPELKPVDAYNAAIIDSVDLDPNVVATLKKSK